MTNTTDDELDSWRTDWASQTPAHQDLQAWLSGARRRARRETAVSLVGVIAMFGIYGVMAFQSTRTEWVALGLAGCVFAALMVLVTVRARRGTWKPVNQSTRAFLELYERRARAQLRLLRISAWLGLSWLVLVGTPFIYSVWKDVAPKSNDFFWGVATGLVPLLIASVWSMVRQHRRATKEQREAATLLAEYQLPT